VKDPSVVDSSASSRSSRPAGARHRLAIVLSGGGARGAYEAGVLSYLFEEIYPLLGDDFEFDIVSGTSVGAIHAAYIAASHGMAPAERSKGLIETWSSMSFETVLNMKWRHLLGVPLRAAGLLPMRRSSGTPGPDGAMQETFGGLLDIAPLEGLVRARIPWERLAANLDAGRPGTVCVAATEITTGMIRLFMAGHGVDTSPWDFDPQVNAVHVSLTQEHVRASAAIPFLFPAVRVGDCFYVDGGIRLNTPLSPAIRMKADRVLVVGVKHKTGPSAPATKPCNIESIAKPAFLLGKLLDAILLDPIENELRQLDVINALLEGGRAAFGTDFEEKLAPYIRAKRGIGYRSVETRIINPSRDLGTIAAESQRESRNTGKGLVSSLITRTASMGTPYDEADFLSYVYFDNSYTQRLIELGREDARADHDAILELLIT
jgi:NTE family protein